jgi:hypothetical protein
MFECMQDKKCELKYLNKMKIKDPIKYMRSL